MRQLALTRLVFAAATTLLVLPVAWGYSFVTPMILWEINYLAVAAVVACGILTFFVTRNLGLILADVSWARWVVMCTAVGWVVAFGVMTYFMVIPTASTPAIVLLFVVSTVWLPCAAWLGYSGPIPTWKWTTLGILVVLSAAFPALVRVEGLTGDLKIDFAWRLAPRRDVAVRQPDIVAAAPVSIGPIGPDDSPQFFGPHRNGAWPNIRLADWNDALPTEIWRRPVGAGWSGIAVVGGYCFTQEQRDEDECVTCYRFNDGSLVWTHAEKTRFASSMGGDGPRATPTIAGGRCYAVGATGKLVCLDAASGKKLWGADLLQEYGGENLMHGVCNSPLVDDDRVIVCPPGEHGPSLAAYHRESGHLLWAAGAQRASYNSPVVWVNQGVKQYLIHNAEGVAGHDPANGRQLWLFPWSNADRINCSQPILDAAGPGTLLISTGYGVGAALVRIKRDGPDNWLAEPAWQSPKRALKTKFTSAVLHEGNAYALDDGILACLDVVTAKLRWKDGRYQHGQVILAGDRLIVQAESGDLIMVAPSPARLQEVGRFAALTDKTWAAPVIAGRHLIVRNDREMACYELIGR